MEIDLLKVNKVYAINEYFKGEANCLCIWVDPKGFVSATFRWEAQTQHGKVTFCVVAEAKTEEEAINQLQINYSCLMKKVNTKLAKITS